MTEPIDLPFGLDSGGRRKNKYSRIRQVALMYPMERRISATWRIRLNRPYAAAMRPYVKLLWPPVVLYLR